MRKFIIAAAVVLAPVSPVMAHGNHDEEEQDRPVQQVAKDNVIKLITKGTLPASWSKAKFVEHCGISNVKDYFHLRDIHLQQAKELLLTKILLRL